MNVCSINKAPRIPRCFALGVVFVIANLFTSTLSAQGVQSSAHAPYANFESGATQALLLSQDGSSLYVLNAPDHRLEVYRLPSRTLTRSLFVGIDPVSMALSQSDPHLLFVANKISDSVSVVDTERGVIIATIPVGDEPQDILVENGKLFVACARSEDPKAISDPWIENALVIVSASAPFPILDRVEIPAHKPRALASDGEFVYVMPLHSGNHTTILSQTDAASLNPRLDNQLELDSFDLNFELNPVLTRNEFNNWGQGWQIPSAGRVVFDWEYPDLVRQLEDFDLVAVHAGTHEVDLGQSVRGLGTTLLNQARDPNQETIWVAGLEAKNRTRMEYNLKGQAFENRLSVVSDQGVEVLRLAPPFTSQEHAMPVDIAFYRGSEGEFTYVATLGSSSVIVIDSQTREVVTEIQTGDLPVALAVDTLRAQLIVLTRGRGQFETYDIAKQHGLSDPPRKLGYNPEPPIISKGRQHLYEARADMGHGTGNFSCASCHIFGHTDFLGWDLGNSDGSLSYFYPDLLNDSLVGFRGTIVTAINAPMNNPMKGPMVTQTFRGIADDLPLHWRGDRRFVQHFQGAFEGLLGGDGIGRSAMQEFTSFVRSLTYPPNPRQPKSRSYHGDELEGANLFGIDSAGKSYTSRTTILKCDRCHEANFVNDFDGSEPGSVFDGGSQVLNTALLRGIYEKENFALSGFGSTHDGSIDGIRAFFDLELLDGGEGFDRLTSVERDQVTDFMMAWDSGTAPLVGSQLSNQQGADINTFLNLAESRASSALHDIDLIFTGSEELGASALPRRPNLIGAKGMVPQAGLDSTSIGAHFLPSSSAYQLSDGRTLSDEDFRVWIAQENVIGILTCVPPGTGYRLGVDRDEDGLLDGQEIALGTSPRDPDSDNDGYDDALELTLGGNPLVADTFLDDQQAPSVVQHEAQDVFADATTLHITLDEPARVRVEVRSPLGNYFQARASAELRRRHDIVITELPSLSELTYEIFAYDQNRNEGRATGAIATAPTQLHVHDIRLTKTQDGDEVVLKAEVVVHNHADKPVSGVPLFAFWHGDLGSNDWRSNITTDARGVATVVLDPYVPQGPSVVSFSPAFLGSRSARDEYFVGRGGDESGFLFFYDQGANKAHFASVEID